MDKLMSNAFNASLGKLNLATEKLDYIINTEKQKTFDVYDCSALIKETKVIIEEIFEELKEKNNG